MQPEIAIWPTSKQLVGDRITCLTLTLCMAPAVLSINAGFHCSSTETAVKPASVMPAAKGCFEMGIEDHPSNSIASTLTSGTLSLSS